MVEVLLETARPKIAEAGKQVEHAREVVNEAYEDFLDKTQRAGKRGRRAVEDLLENADHKVKKYPRESIGGGLLTGLVFGFVIGWLVGRRR